MTQACVSFAVTPEAEQTYCQRATSMCSVVRRMWTAGIRPAACVPLDKEAPNASHKDGYAL